MLHCSVECRRRCYCVQFAWRCPLTTRRRATAPCILVGVKRQYFFGRGRRNLKFQISNFKSEIPSNANSEISNFKSEIA